MCFTVKVYEETFNLKVERRFCVAFVLGETKIDSYRFTAPLDHRRLAESAIAEEPRSSFNEHLRRVIKSRRLKRMPPGSKAIWKDVI